MIILLLFGVISLANVGLLAPIESISNQPLRPTVHPQAKSREFKGQLSPDGAFKVHLTLLAPPVEPDFDRATSGRQYIANKSEELNSDGYIRVQPLRPIKPPTIDPYLIPVSVGIPRQRPNVESISKQNTETSSNQQAVKPRLVQSPFGPVPAGSGLEGQYVDGRIEKQYDDGSDKEDAVTPRIVGSSKGAVPVGSDLEGQYVSDNLEKKFDDGSDKTPKSLQGQYIPDNLEKLYDDGTIKKQFNDGSDKADVFAPRIVDSPNGAVPVGSGLEGQYVPDNLEKKFDDGSDKTPKSLQGQYIPDNLEKLYDDGSDKASTTPSDSLNSVYGREVGESNPEGQQTSSIGDKRFDDGLYRPKDLEKSFDDGLFKPDNLEKTFDDGLYRPEELARRFDDGIIKF